MCRMYLVQRQRGTFVFMKMLSGNMNSETALGLSMWLGNVPTGLSGDTKSL